MAVVVCGLLLAGVAFGCAEVPPSQFVGSETCADCHAEAFAAWDDSLHAKAASEITAGRWDDRFDGARLRGATVTAAAELANGYPRFASVDGRDEAHHPALVLGAKAIEQFLVPVRGGRLQAYPIAYDPARREWFDLVPEGIEENSWGHWKQPGATANAQCLECHVTGYTKAYDAVSDVYQSRWEELGVGCEACHGPGRAHVVFRRGETRLGPDPYFEAVESLRSSGDACMPCHSLRVPIADGYAPGKPLLDFFDPEILDGPAFWADGQLREEAYEWTQFESSRMAAAGVVCQDCHASHSGLLRAEGNALCTRCHEPRYDDVAHTKHRPGQGSLCVGCHMPVQTFMERDDRRDHAFTRPDPGRSRVIGAPDACTMCHEGRGETWASERLEALWGPRDASRQAQYALAVLIESARQGVPSVGDAVARLIASDLDPIRRASLVRLLGAGRDGAAVGVLRAALSDPEPLVRASAARSLSDSAARRSSRNELVGAAGDDIRLVRLEAAFALADVPLGTFGPEDRRRVDQVFGEWLAAQTVIAESPESAFNEGLFWAARGDGERAEAAYRRSIRLWPFDLAPRQNLAMVLLDAGRFDDAEKEFHAVLARAPDHVPSLIGLAGLYRRRQRWPDAVRLLQGALARTPTLPGIALELAQTHLGGGNERAAADAFERATGDPRSRREALRELVRLAHRWNDREMAARWLPESLLADPTTAADPAIREMLGLGEGSGARVP